MRKILSLLAVLVLYSVLAFAQSRIVTGRVADDQGNPIPFASVKVKGSNAGTSADANGNFRIDVGNSQAIEISSTGFGTREVNLTTSNVVSITLSSDVQTIDEVIITAGGLKTTRKEQGYNSTIVKAEQLTAAKPVTIAAGLQGKVAGLQISGVSSGVNPNFRVVLRGMRSLTGNNEALIVLDNVIVPNAILGNLNPEDVAEVNVLNGPNAAALYGSEASNGAILITTKKGTKGAPSIRVSQTLTREQVAFYPKLQYQFGSGADNDVQIYTPYENQQYGPAFDGVEREIGKPLADGSIQTVPYSATREKEDFWQDGITSQTDFSVSSGSERSTIYFSGQYAKQTGTTPGDEYNRASLRLNGTHKLANALDLSFNVGYTQNRYDITTATAGIYTNLLNTPAQIPVTRYKDWRNDPFSNPSGYYNAYYNNPYFQADNNRQTNRNDYLVGSAELNYTPIKWLNFIYRVGVSTRNQSSKSTSDIFRFSEFARAQGSYKAVDLVGGVSDASYYLTRLNSDFLVNMNKDVNDFGFRLTLGGSVRHDESKALSGSINGLVIPGIFNLQNSTNPATASEANYRARQFGVYGKLTVDYKNYLFLTATSRNDWVSTLSPENRSFFYPAFDVSFVPTDAFAGLKDITAIDYIKLRAGWSMVGQVNLGGNFGAYRLNPTFGQGSGFPYNGQGGFSVGNQVVSQDLRPEITTSWETGIDVSLFRQRLVANLTYFDAQTKDQTVSTGVSNATGFSTYLVNTGLTSSKGIESSLQVTPVRTKNFDVSIGMNYTYYKNEVISISDDLPRLQLGAYGSGGPGSYAVAGETFPVLMGSTHRRDPEGRIIVDRLTGYPSATDTISILGGAAPTDILGINLSVRFKNFSLSGLAEYRGGHFIYNAGGGTFDFSGSSYNSALFNRDRFVIPNSSYADPANPGKYIANTNVTVRDGGPGYWTIGGPRTGIAENYVTSAAFWKLRELVLSYDVPVSVLGGGKVIKGATVSLQGRNLIVLLPPSNVYTDPEYSDGNASSSGNAIGLTNLSQTPPSRYYGATISLTF